jgi:cytochrome c553
VVRALSLLTSAACALLYFSPGRVAARSAPVNYILRCSGCHGMDGSGNTPAGIPDFRNYIGAFARDDEGRTYILHVPGIVNASLSDDEISAVINYVVTTWAGTSLRTGFVAFTAQEVAARRVRPVADVVRFRRRIVERLHAAGIQTAAYPWP